MIVLLNEVLLVSYSFTFYQHYSHTVIFDQSLYT